MKYIKLFEDFSSINENSWTCQIPGWDGENVIIAGKSMRDGKSVPVSKYNELDEVKVKGRESSGEIETVFFNKDLKKFAYGVKLNVNGTTARTQALEEDIEKI